MIWYPLIIPIAVGAVPLILARIEVMIVVRQPTSSIDDDRGDMISTYPRRLEINDSAQARNGRGDNY